MASSQLETRVKRYNGIDYDDLLIVTSYNKLLDVPSTFPPSSHNHDTRYVRFDTASQGLTDTQKSNARTNIGAGTSNFTGYTSSDKLSAAYISGLAAVATSGSYNDLSNKPTIYTDCVRYVSQSLTDAQKTQARTNIGAGTYSKPSGGIPASDLAEAYVKTIKVGSTSYSPDSGVVSLPAYPTTLPASDVYAWAKASSKPSYEFNEITNRYHSLISWQGPSIRGGISPLGVALSSPRSACRTDFINANAITIKRSDDGGATWVDTSVSDGNKRSLFTTNFGYSLEYGTTGEATLNKMCRVVLVAQNGTNTYLYTNPRKILINYSSPHPGKVLIEVQTGVHYQAGDGVWATVGEYSLSGWSGWNDIPCVLSTLGGGTTQTGNYWVMRFTFSYESIASGGTNYRTGATNILIFGENDWTRASNAAGFGPISGTGHLYNYDIEANATFPKKLAATEFIENGTTLANKYLTSHQDISGKLDKSGGTMTGRLIVKSPILAYEYNVNTNNAAIIMDKPGSNFTGIGSHGETDTIYFGACGETGVWVDTYKQKWKFNGTIYENGTAIDTIMDNKIQAAIGDAIAASY